MLSKQHLLAKPVNLSSPTIYTILRATWRALWSLPCSTTWPNTRLEQKQTWQSDKAVLAIQSKIDYSYYTAPMRYLSSWVCCTLRVCCTIHNCHILQDIEFLALFHIQRYTVMIASMPARSQTVIVQTVYHLHSLGAFVKKEHMVINTLPD